MSARTSAVCAGALQHRPVYLETDKHHLYPTYLCHLLGVPERRETVTLCAGCHRSVHALLRDLINEGSYWPHQPADGTRDIVHRAYAWWTATILGAAVA